MQIAPTRSEAQPTGERFPRDLPRDADEALHLAIKMAVDGGDYERASLLVDVAKRTTRKPANVTPLAVVRDEHEGAR